MTATADYGARSFLLRALTPIHIGTGERLSPEEYVYDERTQRLARINLAMLLRLMRTEYRARFESLLDAGRIGEAQKMVSDFFAKLRPEHKKPLTRSETAVGPGSAAELRQLHVRTRSGEIFAMARNPYTNRVTVPGSALKGAFRTALLSVRNKGSRSAVFGDALDESSILRYEKRSVDQDPFRLMRVSDSEWPADGVSIDRAVLRKPGRDDGREGIQIHEERLRSRVDDYREGVTVQISLTPADRRRAMGDPLSWRELTEACNHFYRGRLDAEQTRFGFIHATGAEWDPGQLGTDRILLRVGKHCHFDSLSLDGVRQKPGRAGPEPQSIGSTRTVCRIAPGRDFPYGWALLEAVTEGQLS